MPKSLFSRIVSKAKAIFVKDKDFKEISKGGSTAFIINIIGLAAGYIFVMLISKIYKTNSAAIYGEYVLVTLLLRVGSIISRFGTDTTILKLVSGYSTKELWPNILQVNKKLLGLLLSLGTGITLIAILLNKQIGVLLKMPGNMVIIASLFIIPMALGLFYSQSLRGLKKIGVSTFLRSSALPILNLLLLPVFLIFIGKSSTLYPDLPSYTFFASIVITAIVGFIYWIRAVPKDVASRYTYDNTIYLSAKQLFTLSYPLLLAESMIFIGTWVDQLLLGVLGTTADVGIFNVCVKYAMVASMSLQAVNTIAAPRFSEYFFKEDYTGLAVNVQKTTKAIFWTTIPIVLIYLVFPTFLLGIFGESFKPGWLAFVILTIGALINVMTGSVGTLLQMTGHQKTLQNILIVSVIIEAGLNVVLIPMYGITGAAIASVAGTAIKNFGMSFYVKKYFHFSSIYFPLITK